MLDFFKVLENFMIPCIWKSIFHIDCPGCGLQRSLLLLFQGKLTESYKMYAPTIPILLVMLLGALHIKFKWKNGQKIIVTSFIAVAIFIMISYFLKITSLV